MINQQNKWIRWTSLLFVTLFCMGMLTPAETMAETMAETLAAPEQPQAIAPSSYIPLLRNNVCRGKRASSNPIGVQIYGNTGYNEKHFQLLQNTESPWIRNSIFWPSVEPSNVAPSAYNWAHSDAVLSAAKDNCANMIATIDNTPEWATTGDDRSPIQPALLPEYVQFVRATVERYDGDGIDDAPGGIVVNYWEFYNEPDFGTTSDGGGWGEHGDQYAAMLKAVYPAVKAANPNAKVVFGGIALNFFTIKNNGLFVEEFLDDVLDAGGGQAFDIMNLHHYPFPNNRESWTESKSSGLMEKIAFVREKLAGHGFTGDLAKPLMVTEVGWHSDNNDLYPSSDDYQSRHIIQMLTQSVASDAIAAIWWTFYDASGYPYETGLTVPPNTAKASYVVYRDAVKRLGQAEFVSVVMPATVDNNLEIYEFREGGTNKTMYIAWLNPIAPFNAEAAQTFDDSVTQNWQAPGNKATIYRKDGSLLQTVNDGDDGSNDGQITVTIGKSPIYIVIN